jgi:hypothetical protein
MMLQSSELKLPLHPSRKRYFYFYLVPRFKNLYRLSRITTFSNTYDINFAIGVMSGYSQPLEMNIVT